MGGPGSIKIFQWFPREFDSIFSISALNEKNKYLFGIPAFNIKNEVLSFKNDSPLSPPIGNNLQFFYESYFGVTSVSIFNSPTLYIA